MLDGLAHSLNTITLAAANQLDLCKFQEMAFAAGIHNGKSAAGETRAARRQPALAPSAAAATLPRWPWPPAFATFAAEGLMCEPRALVSVTAADGTHLSGARRRTASRS